jgi:DNA-binding transcriptional LysR family regulator
MELKHLHYFTEVVKQGSFSKAAEKLFISQPNISNIIKDLEEELDVKLLIRTTRKLEVTDMGQLLFQYGMQISQTLQHLYQEIDDRKNSKKGIIKIGIFPMLGQSFFTKITSEFHQHYPEISVRFVEDGAEKLKHSLLEGEVDLAVMEMPADHTVFEGFPFLKADLHLLVHHQHPLANKKTVTWSQLVNEPFIILREGFHIHDLILNECQRHGFDPEIICETSQWNFMIEMVRINKGITILPLSNTHEILQNYQELTLLNLNDPKIDFQLGIAWKKDSYQSFATRTWIQFVKERL